MSSTKAIFEFKQARLGYGVYVNVPEVPDQPFDNKVEKSDDGLGNESRSNEQLEATNTVDGETGEVIPWPHPMKTGGSNRASTSADFLIASSPEQIGVLVAESRKESGMTQEQLADVTGLSRRLVGKLERGEANPTVETLARIAAAFDKEPAIGFKHRDLG